LILLTITSLVEVVDIITYHRFYSDWLNDVDSVGVKNGLFSLTRPVAVDKELHDCTAHNGILPVLYEFYLVAAAK